jgi:hypothetical protein
MNTRLERTCSSGIFPIMNLHTKLSGTEPGHREASNQLLWNTVYNWRFIYRGGGGGKLSWCTLIFLNSFTHTHIYTLAQATSSLDQTHTRPQNFSITLIIDALCPWGWFSLTETSTWSLPGSKGWPKHKANNLITIRVNCLCISQPYKSPWPIIRLPLPSEARSNCSLSSSTEYLWTAQLPKQSSNRKTCNININFNLPPFLEEFHPNANHFTANTAVESLDTTRKWVPHTSFRLQQHQKFRHMLVML